MTHFIEETLTAVMMDELHIIVIKKWKYLNFPHNKILMKTLLLQGKRTRILQIMKNVYLIIRNQENLMVIFIVIEIIIFY